MRMRSAKARLLNTDDPVKVIAADLGFEDPYHFSRRFKNLEGMSPENFRKSFIV
jgi:AraC family transcriptional regulator of arabinose operon